MDAVIKQRDFKPDFFKGLAILFILLWHFGFVATQYFIWAIPLFVFTTAALYQDRIERLTLKKILQQAIWIFGLIVVFTILADSFGLVKIVKTNFSWSIGGLFKYYILRNPFLGALWYFVLYFQELLLLWIIGKLDYKKVSSWGFGFIFFIIGLIWSYLVLRIFSEGVTFNIFSWIFFIWLGLFQYKNIFSFLEKKSNTFKLICVVVLAGIIFFILYSAGAPYLQYLKLRTHDPLLPTIVLQLCYFFVIFSVTAIKELKGLLKLFGMLGFFSMYIYIFHQFFYDVVFTEAGFGVADLLLTVLACIIVGLMFEKIRNALFGERPVTTQMGSVNK